MRWDRSRWVSVSRALRNGGYLPAHSGAKGRNGRYPRAHSRAKGRNSRYPRVHSRLHGWHVGGVGCVRCGGGEEEMDKVEAG